MDTYGRLPSDVLKYISLLAAMPHIDNIENTLIIKTPFMTYEVNFLIISEGYDKDEIDDMIEEINIFNRTNSLLLYLGEDDKGHNNYLSIGITHHETIVITDYTDNYKIILPIMMLEKLKSALNKYAQYLRLESANL